MFLLHRHEHLRHANEALLELVHDLAQRCERAGQGLRHDLGEGVPGVDRLERTLLSAHDQTVAMLRSGLDEERDLAEFEEVAVAEPRQPRRPAVQQRPLAAEQVHEPRTVRRVDNRTVEV